MVFAFVLENLLFLPRQNKIAVLLTTKKEPSKISTTKVLKLNSSLNRQSVKRIQISFVAKSLIGTQGGAFVRLPLYRLDRAQRLIDYRARLSSRGIRANIKLLHNCNYYNINVTICQSVFCKL